jgi:hypothetical protein
MSCVLAVSGAPGFSDGIGAAAKFTQPSSIVALRHGDEDILYIADTGSNAVRRVTIVAGLAEILEEEVEEAAISPEVEEAAISPLDASEEGDAANRKLLFSASRHAPLQAQVCSSSKTDSSHSFSDRILCSLYNPSPLHTMRQSQASVMREIRKIKQQWKQLQEIREIKQQWEQLYVSQLLAD